MLSALSDWFLCGIAEAEAGRAVVRIDQVPFIIGRRPGLNLTLDSLCVSGRHAELSTRGDRLFVADLGSRNGTLVNGKRIRKASLGIGDLLKVGDIEFRLDRRPRSEARGRSAPAAADLDTMQLKWLAAQFSELTRESVLTAELRPVVRLPDETVVAYEALGQSPIAGLETEAKMCEAARLLGREKELNRLLLHGSEGVMRSLPAGCWLLLRTPAAVNLESEVVPVLKVLRQQAPHGRVVVEVVDAASRSQRSLADFVVALKSLDMQLAIGNFVWEHIRFLQSARLLPLAVRFDSSLTQNMAQKSDTERRRIRTMVASLHQYRIQTVVQGVESRDDALACGELEIDFAGGPLFGEPLPLSGKPLLDTCLVTSSALSALNDAPAPLPDAGLPAGEDGLFDAGADLPDGMQGGSDASVLDDANDPADDFSSRLGSASFRLPPPTR